ncbi:DUF1428 domain-containing protein [Candidatus Nomurabacteria bacterium]|nr:DUF1428 domain-containing protein [Candidatus Nomurabacteria bacterium]
MKTNSKKYVDGFVIPLKKKDLEAYKKMATWGAKTWMKYGALSYFECVAEDIGVKKGMGMGFKKLANLKPKETLIFSFIVYRSKADRDRINKKVMSDPGMKDFDEKSMPVDMSRFVTGGFDTLVEG